MFMVIELAEAMVDAVVPLVAAVEERDRPLADQMRRAAQSLVLNLAESQGVHGGNRRLHFERAAGSNRELRAALRMAVRWGYVHAAPAQACDGAADQVGAILWRLTHPVAAG